MKLIETTFRKGGFDFTQVERAMDWCVYSKTKPHFQTTHWEVMRIKSHNGREISGNVIPPSEYLPSSEEWGLNGFSFKTKESAMEFFKEKTK